MFYFFTCDRSRLYCTGFRLRHIRKPATLRDPAKSGSGQVSSRIWIFRICRMSVQLQFIQLTVDKTNASGLSSGIYTILSSVTRTIKNTKFIAVPPNSDVTKELLKHVRCLLKTADSIVGAMVSPGVLDFMHIHRVRKKKEPIVFEA